MANYNNLLSTINGAIKTNGAGAITGQLLQTILDGMVASLGAKYQYAGVATPSTNPGTPDENVFYLATQAGTYTNFRGLVVDDGEVCALKWDGTWVKEVTGAATAEQVSQLGQEIYGITNIQSTNVKLYSVISENFALVQHGNGADIYSCSVEAGKRYKVNFYPIFSSNDTGTYIWVFTNTANTIDLTTAIAHSELYTEHFSGPTTEIELVAPQFAKTLYVLSSGTPVITEYRDLAGNTTDNLNSFASGNALSANAGRQAAYIANQKGLSLGLKHICNGEPIIHIDISNIGENKWIKEKNFAENYFIYSLTDTSNVWFATPEFHPTGRNLIHIKFRIKIERTGGATNTMTIYISNATAPGGVYYHSVATIGDDGYFDLVFDPAHYVVYEQWEHFYIWFWMNGAVSASQKVSFKIYDLQIVEYDEKTSFANISGETAKALFESTDAKLTEIDSKTNDSIPTLIAPNGAKYIMAIDNNGNISPIPVIPNKATIFGNSLVSGFSYVGGDSFGMCASAPNKAFKSLFYDYISSVNPSFVGAKYGAAPFETISDVSQIDYAINAYFLPALVGDEDLVIIELGDNVSVANEPVFAQSSVALLQAIRAKCPNARVVWLGIWYGIETKYNIVKNACEVVGCEFITLSELVTSENMGAIGNVIEQGLDDRTISDVSNVVENTATNITITFNVNGTSYNATMDVVSYSLSGTTLSYRGNYGIVTSGGVASHPGDRGMKAIANKLLYKLGIVNDTEYYPL